MRIGQLPRRADIDRSAGTGENDPKLPSTLKICCEFDFFGAACASSLQMIGRSRAL
jgi:hypothetical protein